MSLYLYPSNLLVLLSLVKYIGKIQIYVRTFGLFSLFSARAIVLQLCTPYLRNFSHHIGSTKIQEWFPFNASGDPTGPRRQVRPVHPYSSIREAGSKKRRRVAMGSQTWTIGDRVDAFIQDA